MSVIVKYTLGVAVLASLSQYLFGTVNLYRYAQFLLEEENYNTQICVMDNCRNQMVNCLQDYNCFRALGCILRCGVTESKGRQPACSYVCEMTHGYENDNFLSLINCMLSYKCFVKYLDDGICHGSDKDGVETIDSMEKIAGDWWVIGGLNCGDESYPGGYDWYPCQHERFIYLPQEKRWINNVTYCDGKDNTCTSDFIITIANVSVPSPGVVLHDYTDAPLSPQQEKWRVVSWPDSGDFLLMLWCGRLPILNYNGGIVLSRDRSGVQMPEKIRNEFRQVAKGFGLDYDTFCVSDNSWCPL